MCVCEYIHIRALSSSTLGHRTGPYWDWARMERALPAGASGAGSRRILIAAATAAAATTTTTRRRRLARRKAGPVWRGHLAAPEAGTAASHVLRLARGVLVEVDPGRLRAQSRPGGQVGARGEAGTEYYVLRIWGCCLKRNLQK